MSYTWFYDENKYDSIGISNECKYMIHDDIMIELKLFRKFEKKENNRYAKYILYELVGQTDLILHEKTQILYFKYIGKSYNNMVFDYIGYNRKQFK